MMEFNGHSTATAPVWTRSELRRFWAIARSAGLDADGVHRLIAGIYPGRKRLHDLSRSEFMALLGEIEGKTGRVTAALDRHFAGTAMEPQWRTIRWLQRKLAWSDTRLIAYIRWHGRRQGHAVDHIRWLTPAKARGIITGMHRIAERSPSPSSPPRRQGRITTMRKEERE